MYMHISGLFSFYQHYDDHPPKSKYEHYNDIYIYLHMMITMTINEGKTMP